MWINLEYLAKAMMQCKQGMTQSALVHGTATGQVEAEARVEGRLLADNECNRGRHLVQRAAAVAVCDAMRSASHTYAHK